MDNQLLKTVLKDIYFLSQVRARLKLLRLFLNQKFFNSQFDETSLPEADLNWLKSLGEDTHKQFTHLNTEEILQKLEQDVQQIETVKLFVAAELPQSGILKIGRWLGQNYPGFLFDIKIDPDLIGGAALSYKGIYKDYSLKARIEERKEELWLQEKR